MIRTKPDHAAVVVGTVVAGTVVAGTGTGTGGEAAKVRHNVAPRISGIAGGMVAG